MIFKEFDELINRAFLYLGADMPTKAQRDEWFAEVKRIPNEAIPAIWEQLKQRDGISRRTNVPKVILEIAGKMINPDGSQSTTVRYDPIDDIRFPVNLMRVGYEILEKQGMDALKFYCDSVWMPRNDRARVVAKFRAVQEANDGKISIGEAMEKMSRGGDRSVNPQKIGEIIPF